MPELAEVEYYRKQWDPGLGGTVAEVLTHPRARPFRGTASASIETSLGGTRLEGSQTHGKRILFGFSGGNWLGIHLGMTGKLAAHADGFERGKHDHLVLRLEGVDLVFNDPRMFGKITFDQSPDEPSWWRNLPPEILDRKFTRAAVARFLGRFHRSPVKSILLDQRGFPGVGNWMADEICWRARLSPATPGGALDGDAVTCLHRACRAVARTALETIGRDWSDPPKTWLFSRRWRDGGFCPRRGCGAALLRESLRGRTTCWCPRCQA